MRLNSIKQKCEQNYFLLWFTSLCVWDHLGQGQLRTAADNCCVLKLTRKQTQSFSLTQRATALE